MTGNSLAHKRITLRDIALPKHRGHLLLTTEPQANRRSRAGQAATLRFKDDGQETQTRVLSAFYEAKRALLGSSCP